MVEPEFVMMPGQQPTMVARRNGYKTPNVSPGERWISAIAGGALALGGLRWKTPLNIVAALSGGYLLFRGISGNCALYRLLGIYTFENRIHIERTVTINKPAEELFRFWRNFENLPTFMHHIESIQMTNDRRSFWRVKAPGNFTVSWDAEVVEERPNEYLAWKSLPGGDITHAGIVHFVSAPDGRGTEVHITLTYEPPAGTFGAAVARAFGRAPAQQVQEDLRRFKQMMEAGEIPTTEGQPSGRA